MGVSAQFEEEVKALRLETSALRDEVQRINEEKLETEQQYRESLEQQRELQLRLQTLQLAEIDHQEHSDKLHRKGSSSVATKLRQSFVVNTALTKENSALVAENTADRDDWQNKCESTEQEK